MSVPADLFGWVWLSVVVYGCLWLSVAVCGCLLPELFENNMIGVPGFQSLRSKEIWIDGFAALPRHHFRISLIPQETVRISSEMRLVVEMEHGLRILLQWCAGAYVPARKDALQ